jgi:hypothetical protein
MGARPFFCYMTPRLSRFGYFHDAQRARPADPALMCVAPQGDTRS